MSKNIWSNNAFAILCNFINLDSFFREFLIYSVLYLAIALTYRFLMKSDQKLFFEKLCLQFEHYTDLVPISFVLGKMLFNSTLTYIKQLQWSFETR